MFRQNDWGILIGNGLMIGIKEAANVIVGIFMDLGKTIWDILSYPIAAFSTGWKVQLEGIMLGLSKIPGVNKLLGLEGFQMTSLGDMWESSLKDIQGLAQGSKGNKLFDASAEKKEITDAFNAASVVFQQKKRDLYDSANQKGPAATGSIDMPEGPMKKLSNAAGQAVATDALQRIGLTVGGGSMQSRIADMTREHVSISKSMLTVLQRMAEKTTPKASYA
jgi:hypothetical protein